MGCATLAGRNLHIEWLAVLQVNRMQDYLVKQIIKFLKMYS